MEVKGMGKDEDTNRRIRKEERRREDKARNE